MRISPINYNYITQTPQKTAKMAMHQEKSRKTIERDGNSFCLQKNEMLNFCGNTTKVTDKITNMLSKNTNWEKLKKHHLNH